MPGRYSHSVVLAGYSSQGIINLSNEQHLEYLKTSPYPTTAHSKGAANSKGLVSEQPPRSQSAMNFHTGRWTPTSGRVTSLGRRYILESEDSQLARRTQSALNKGLSNAANTRSSNGSHNRDETSTSASKPRSALRTLGQAVTRKGMPNSAQDSSTVKNVEKPSADSYIGPPQVQRRAFSALARIHPSDSPVTSGKKGNVDVSAHARTPSDNIKALTNSVTPYDDPAHHRDHLYSQSNSVTPTQTAPVAYSADEPDFDGFSDVEESTTSYFSLPNQSTEQKVEMHKTPVPSVRNSETPPPQIMARSRQAYHQHFGSPSSSRSDRNNTAVSEDSTGKLNSLTSISSFGSTAGISALRTKQADAKKIGNQPHRSEWGLPEIKEDNVFDPEIFAQDLDQDLRPDSSGVGFGESTFGMVSSGRDVNFAVDSDDASSIADSACPPDIGRYRDSDEVAPLPFKTRLKSEENRAPSPGLQSNKSKKGFLSRLTSRSGWR